MQLAKRFPSLDSEPGMALPSTQYPSREQLSPTDTLTLADALQPQVAA